MDTLEQKIIADIRRVAAEYGIAGGGALSQAAYMVKASFSDYEIFDNGRNWRYYCEKSGFVTAAMTPVPDDAYFSRVRGAFEKLGRTPTNSERKMFGLNFPKRRWANMAIFLDAAREHGYLPKVQVNGLAKITQSTSPTSKLALIEQRGARPIPPIPAKSKRNKWERTLVDGFPYAPQDESGVVALFAILCASGRLPFQVLALNGGKGLDAVCWDERTSSEVIIELKHILSKSSWNHHNQTLDMVVCWENRWLAFDKPVIELRSLLATGG